MSDTNNNAPAIANMSNDELIVQWQKVKDAAKKAALYEMEMRKEIARRIFPNAGVGTNTHELGRGYELKLERKQTYKLDQSQVENARNEIIKTSNEGAFILDRLFKVETDIIVSEYKKLSPDLKAVVDKILTIKDATPSLELKEPK